MLDPGRAFQCPFLNRADARCSRYFNLDQIGHVLEHCFDDYRQCSTFTELMAERRLRTRDDAEEELAHGGDGIDFGQNRIIPLVQITLPGPDLKRLRRAS